MASTTTRTSDAYKGRYMQLVCTQEMDVANNKSKIHWTLSSIGGEVNYYSTGPTSVYINGKCVYYKDRVNYTAEVFPAAKGSVSGTVEIEHNEDGTKGVSVLMNTVVYYGSGSVKAYSGWWELDTIPRGAKIQTAPSSFTNASLPTITYTNPLGDKASKLEICIANSAGSVVAPYRALSKTGTSYTFASSDMVALNNKIAGNGDILEVLFIIRTTTADGNVFEDKKPSTYKMVETSDTKPSVTMTLSASNPSSYPSALASIYIQGKSGVKATITGTGKYGATISKYALNVGGVTESSTSNIITSNAVTTSGDKVSVIGSAVDTRGFTGTASTTISVLEYSKPLVIPLGGETAIQCYRSDSSGVRKGSSTSVRIKAKRSYYGLNGNNKCKLQWRRKPASETWNDSSHTWTDLIARTTTTDEYDANLSGVTFELNKAYSVQIRAIDDLGEFDIKNFDIPTRDVALHLGHGGKNVSIGEYCDYVEQYTFRSSWKAFFDNGIHGSIYPEEASGDLLEFALSSQRGLVTFYTTTSTTNIPTNGGYAYAVGFVLTRKDGEGANRQANIFLMEPATGTFAINNYHYESGGWQGWKYHTPHS